MKKKYITLEEVLAFRGTDTKIYFEHCSLVHDNTYTQDPLTYYKFNSEVLCKYNAKDDKLIYIYALAENNGGYYILEPEEFKVERTGRYRTRDGRIAYVAHIKRSRAFGMIESVDALYIWEEDGKPSYGCTLSTTDKDDLVEYVGD